MNQGSLNCLAMGAAIACATSGCVSAAVPTDRLASAEAAIRAAREVSAGQTSPQGALHLRLALEQRDAAKMLMASEDNKRAAWVLRRAEADAEVALQLAREERAKGDAEKALENVTALKWQGETQ